MLEVIDAVGATGADVASLRTEIAAAREPDVFVADGDDVF